MNIEETAANLKKLIDEQKQFKKEYKAVFSRNHELNKSIRELKDQLVFQMKTDGMNVFEYEGMEFNLKEKSIQKHDIELINEMIGDTNKFEEYVGKIRTDKSDVSTRKTKRVKQ